jgi:hypothetical protein
LLSQLSASPEAMAASAVLLLLIATCCTLPRRQPAARAMPRRPDCCPKQSSASRHARPHRQPAASAEAEAEDMR